MTDSNALYHSYSMGYTQFDVKKHLFSSTEYSTESWP